MTSTTNPFTLMVDGKAVSVGTRKDRAIATAAKLAETIPTAVVLLTRNSTGEILFSAEGSLSDVEFIAAHAVVVTDPEPTPAPEPAAAAPLAGVEIGKAKIVAATADALGRLPKGSKSRVAEDGSLVVADGEAAAVVTAITEHMRAGVKADRGGFMYTEGKLRQVRAAVIAAHPDGAAGLPQPKAKGAAGAGKLARVEALNDQLAAARAAKAAAKTSPAKAKQVG